jgi:hypothetical protein
MISDFSELSYLLANAPVDLVCQNRRVIYMNNRWYLEENGKLLDYSIMEDDFHNALTWLVDDFWVQETGRHYNE